MPGALIGKKITRPGPQNIIEARPRSRAEARTVQDPSGHPVDYERSRCGPNSLFEHVQKIAIHAKH